MPKSKPTTKARKDPDAQTERSFETGMDEAFKFFSEMVAANTKRTYDEYQDLALNTARVMNTMVAQVIQNAIVSADMVAKQAIRHSDIAIDRQWNIDEQVWGAVEIIEGKTAAASTSQAQTKGGGKKKRR